MRTMNNIKNETSTSSLYFLYIIVLFKIYKNCYSTNDNKICNISCLYIV